MRAAPAEAAGEDGCASCMSESGPPDPLRRIGDEIDKARERAGQGGSTARRDVTSSGSALGFGLRAGIELLAGLCVGLALGWVADRYIGTRPWGLIVGFLLGSAAGVVNVFRAVQGLGGPPAGR